MGFKRIEKGQGGGSPLTGIRLCSRGPRYLGLALGADARAALGVDVGSKVAIDVGSGPDAGRVRLTKSDQGFSLYLARKDSVSPVLQIGRPLLPTAKSGACSYTVDGNAIIVTLPQSETGRATP